MRLLSNNKWTKKPSSLKTSETTTKVVLVLTLLFSRFRITWSRKRRPQQCFIKVERYHWSGTTRRKIPQRRQRQSIQKTRWTWSLSSATLAARKNSQREDPGLWKWEQRAWFSYQWELRWIGLDRTRNQESSRWTRWPAKGYRRARNAQWEV